MEKYYKNYIILSKTLPVFLSFINMKRHIWKVRTFKKSLIPYSNKV